MTARPAPDRIAYLCRRLYERMLAEVYAALPDEGFGDIRPAHSAVLRNLPDEGARPSVLAEWAAMTKQSMGALVEDLAALGYVEVGADAADRRARLVKPTARGRQAQAVLTRLSREAEARLGDRIGAAPVEALRAHLLAATAD